MKKLGGMRVVVSKDRRWRSAFCFLLLIGWGSAGTACGGSEDGALAAPQQPDGWADDLRLSSTEDLNPDPDTLEIELRAYPEKLEILPGVLTEMWTYDGSVPGPLLRAKRGDRLIVHFENELPEPTTIHWHGLRVPASMDGTEAVQNPVLPGESFTYDFILLDAGTFWYHPHVNSGAQVGYGLYGPIVVDDPDDPLPHDDVVLVFSDLSLDEDGQLRAGDHNGWFGDYFGREGAVLLVNGRVDPHLGIRPGLSQRWRIINAARSRFFGMTVPGGRMIRVGGDAGLSDRPLPLEQLVLHPSERAEVIVNVDKTDETEIVVPFQDVDRFQTGMPEADRPLFTLELFDPVSPRPNDDVPDQLSEFPALSLEGVARRDIVLGETESGDMTVNGVAFPGIEDTPHIGYVGRAEVWSVKNETDYPHPFHLHGFSFRVLDVASEPWPVQEWKDTANIPPRSTLRFYVEYDERPGLWMFHCHVLGHAKLGMMSLLDIRAE